MNLVFAADTWNTLQSRSGGQTDGRTDDGMQKESRTESRSELFPKQAAVCLGLVLPLPHLFRFLLPGHSACVEPQPGAAHEIFTVAVSRHEGSYMES